eukprot:CAMPEP_0185730260 /NCGR_PEP_ID=MMETSP1171-20130828/9139_1 /TAXON_ID=374046 /ORGANISM="Helicotheca tamensis, Strain CCMP826" /LENGTH=305 /DNA_ID=CAMNT_0028399273 /DNA_START=86 /DNA_END=1003 /DNA_ORIENTATION=-
MARNVITTVLLILAATTPAAAFTSSSLSTRSLARPAIGNGAQFMPSHQASSSAPITPLKTNKRRKGGDLQMVGSGVAAITGAITGGVFAGSLHAIAGPDHLAALLPRCCGQRWYRAGRVGALWGMGHGVSATILGVLAFGLKSKFQAMQSKQWLIHGASSFMEIAVGASLIFIGLLGIREAREWEAEIEGGAPQSLSAAAADVGVKETSKRAVVFNGLLHGFSWDGAPSLAPAIAVATWRGNISFLLSYAIGTMAAMTLTTTLIGEATRRAGEVFHRPDIPQKLSLVSSFIAIAVGGIWCGLALR